MMEGLSKLIEKGWICHDINDGSAMKRGEEFVITDLGGCTHRKKEGGIEIFTQRFGTKSTFSSWEISQKDGGLREDRAAFQLLAPTSVPAIQLSHLSWFSLKNYAFICNPNLLMGTRKIKDGTLSTGDLEYFQRSNINRLCVAAQELYEPWSESKDVEKELKFIKKRRRTFYETMVSEQVQAELNDTYQWKYFEILRPYISYPKATDEKKNCEEKIREPTKQT